MSFLNSILPSSDAPGARIEAEPSPALRPVYEVAESDGAYTLTVNLPGVSKDGLEIIDEGGELRITGKRARRLPEGAVGLPRASSDAACELVLAPANTIDSGKIDAELRDGVLELKLAKAESARPRKISVS